MLTAGGAAPRVPRGNRYPLPPLSSATVRLRRLPREEVPEARAAVPRRTSTGARHPASGVKSRRGRPILHKGASAPPHPSPASTYASRKTQVTSGTPRVPKQPIPISGRVLAFFFAFGGLRDCYRDFRAFDWWSESAGHRRLVSEESAP